VGKNSDNFSTLSVTQSIVAYGAANRSVAVYKGLKVAVYTVDKTELSLTRTDLIELINVRTDLFIRLELAICVVFHFYCAMVQLAGLLSIPRSSIPRSSFQRRIALQDAGGGGGGGASERPR